MLVKRALFLLNEVFAIAILHLISQVHLPSFVKMLPKYLKDCTFSSRFLVYHNFYWEWLFWNSHYFCVIIPQTIAIMLHSATELANFDPQESHIIRYGLTWGLHLYMEGRETETAGCHSHAKYSGGTLCQIFWRNIMPPSECLLWRLRNHIPSKL